MANAKLPEVWLRGPVPNILPQLQPVAHALLQAKEEVLELVNGFPDHLLWQKPGGVASVGFHLQHLTGVIDRLLTYAHGHALTVAQLVALKAEGEAAATSATTQQLAQAFNAQVDSALLQLQAINADELFAHRGVGRAQLPSTVLGLLFHAAEHTMRHTGQLLVTVRVLQSEIKK